MKLISGTKSGKFVAEFSLKCEGEYPEATIPGWLGGFIDPATGAVDGVEISQTVAVSELAALASALTDAEVESVRIRIKTSRPGVLRKRGAKGRTWGLVLGVGPETTASDDDEAGESGKAPA
jgi:hypothetical protein